MVGLAVARALARRGLEVLVLEASDVIGNGISSRNSEVVHAGLYYPVGSLKARSCVAGKRALYAFCRDWGVPVRRIGKLVVAAAPDQLAVLEQIRARGAACGVSDLKLLTKQDVQILEPALACSGALLSPSTGIIDSHAFMLALQGDAEDHGAAVVFRSPVLGGAWTRDGFVIRVGGEQPSEIGCGWLINCAGLTAPVLAQTLDGVPSASIPRQYIAKGNYFVLTGQMAPFSRLIYPVPEPGGLGVHLTLDLGGQAKFGPDVEWVDRIDYRVDPGRGRRFYAAIRQYWPGLQDGSLAPGYAGIRPKLVGPGEPAADFLIQDPSAHGVPGLINLYGIESPGLTAALSLADSVADLCFPAEYGAGAA